MEEPGGGRKWNRVMLKVGGRIAVLGLVIAGLGVPLVSFSSLLLLLLATVLVVSGRVRRIRVLWLAAVVGCGTLLLVKMVLPLPRIEEGHNVFIEKPCCTNDSAFARVLPPEVYASLRDAFHLRFPLGVAPEPDSSAFAYSADSFWSRPRPRWSRVVRGIDFTDRWELRLGVMNTLRYNVWNESHGVTRETLPYFVTYALPPEMHGGTLCWKGEVFWPRPDGSLEQVIHDQHGCRSLEGPGPWQVWGVEVAPDRPLAMALEPPLSVRILKGGLRMAELLGAMLPLVLLVRVRRRQAWVPAAAVLSVLLGAVLAYPHIASGFVLLEGGNDGLTYMDYARQNLEALSRRDWWGAFRGGEDVFYYMPGQRYVFTVLAMLSGDTLLAWLWLGCLMPLTLYALMLRLMPSRWALVLMAVFLTVPALESFGFWNFYYARLLVRGFTEPFGYGMAFLALALLLPPLARRESGDGPAAAAPCSCPAVLAGGGFCLALAVISRPNLVPGAGMLLLGLSWPWMRQRQWRPLLALAAGFLPVLLLPLHNLLYGGVLVPLTRAADIDANLQASPADYVRALTDAATLHTVTPAVAKVLEKLRYWIAPYEVWRMAAVAVVLWLALAARDRALRLMALVALAQHGMLLFYMSTGRYGYFVWTLSLLSVVALVARQVAPREG